MGCRGSPSTRLILGFTQVPSFKKNTQLRVGEINELVQSGSYSGGTHLVSGFLPPRSAGLPVGVCFLGPLPLKPTPGGSIRAASGRRRGQGQNARGEGQLH